MGPAAPGRQLRRLRAAPTGSAPHCSHPGWALRETLCDFEHVTFWGVFQRGASLNVLEQAATGFSSRGIGRTCRKAGRAAPAQ